MTDNPLLQSKEDKFQRPQLEKEGNNPFAADPPEQVPQGEKEETPVYVTSYGHRGGLLIGLGVTGLLFNMIGISAFSGLSPSLAVFTLFAFGPGIAAWTLSSADLRAIHAGAMDAAGETPTRLAYWLGIAAVGLAVLAICSFIALLFAMFG